MPEKTYFIVSDGTKVSLEGKNIVLTNKNKNAKEIIHSFKVKQIVVMANVNLTTPVIKFLLKNGIDLVFVSKHGKYYGRLMGEESKNSKVRKIQFQKVLDAGFSLAAAKKIVKGKIRNQIFVLKEGARSNKKVNLKPQTLKLTEFLEEVENAKDKETLLGYEGGASRVYFNGFGNLLKNRMNFGGRTKRPPTDPVNALLSFGYTLLLSQVLSLCYRAALDPYFGVFHTVEFSKPSLALDLMEEFRPIVVDKLVLKLVNLGILTQKHFERFSPTLSELNEYGSEIEILSENESITPSGRAVKLTEEGLRRFLTRFDERLSLDFYYPASEQNLSLISIIEKQVYLFRSYLEGKTEYRPFLL